MSNNILALLIGCGTIVAVFAIMFGFLAWSDWQAQRAKRALSSPYPSLSPDPGGKDVVDR